MLKIKNLFTQKWLKIAKKNVFEHKITSKCCEIAKIIFAGKKDFFILLHVMLSTKIAKIIFFSTCKERKQDVEASF